MEAVGVKIRHLRKAQNISLDRLSEATGIDQGYLSKIETGVIKSPYIDTLEKIAQALSCQVRDFLFTEQVRETHLVKEGEQEYPVTITPGLQRINVYSEEEADSVNKLLHILRGPDEPAKISIKGFLDTIIGLIEKKVGKKESNRKVA